MRVDPPQRWWFRARRSHLETRLPAGALARAAEVGIQDSAPRAGLLSLAARVEDVGPTAWEDPSLVQVWHRGGAVYIFPRDTVATFTLGCLPRDPDHQRALQRLADDVHRFVGDTPRRIRDVTEVVPMVRHTGVTGRVHIRWDARDTRVIPVEAPHIDVEEARLDAARRFVWGFGPTTLDDFVWWAGIPPHDGRQTWGRIESELASVEVGTTTRWVLAADAEGLRDAEPLTGVRLLPMNDHFLVLDPARRRETILVDGQVRGTFQRQQARVTLLPSKSMTKAVRDAVVEEAERWATPLGKPVQLRWGT